MELFKSSEYDKITITYNGASKKNKKKMIKDFNKNFVLTPLPEVLNISVDNLTYCKNVLANYVHLTFSKLLEMDKEIYDNRALFIQLRLTDINDITDYSYYNEIDDVIYIMDMYIRVIINNYGTFKVKKFEIRYLQPDKYIN